METETLILIFHEASCGIAALSELVDSQIEVLTSGSRLFRFSDHMRAL